MFANLRTIIYEKRGKMTTFNMFSPIFPCIFGQKRSGKDTKKADRAELPYPLDESKAPTVTNHLSHHFGEFGL